MLDFLIYSRPVRCTRMRTSPFMPIIIFTVVIAGAMHAAADPLARPTGPEATACLLRGNRLYSVRDFDKAIEQYKAGALLEDAPVFQYNLAQAYRVSGRYEDALWHYERFLKRTNPTGALRDTIDGFVKEMQQEMQRGATTQQPLSVAPQHVTATSRVHVSRSGQHERWYQDRLGWGLMSAGAILAATGIYFLTSAHSMDERALAEPGDTQRMELQASASSRRVAGYVLGGSALAFIGGGVVRLALHDGSTGSSSMSVSFSGRF